MITLLSSGIFNRKGYEQDGWATEANGAKVYDLGASYRNNADLTLFPSWKIINYTIEYVCDDCINNPQNPTEYNVLSNSGIKSKDVIVPEGYKFGGWFKDGSYKNQVTQITAGTTGNMKLYGKLNRVYKITYIGTGNPQSDTTYTVDDAVTLNEPKIREGYSFGGWYDNKAFNGVSVTNIAKGSTGDKTFYAKWTKDDNVLDYHTITYVVDGNVVATDFYTEKDAVTLADLTKDGYELDGWYMEVDENGFVVGDTVLGFNAGQTDDKIFYARKGNPIEYTATYDLAKGSMDGSSSFEFTVESENIPLPTPTKNGYTFAGWLDSKAKKVITTLPKGSIGDRTLTAQWVADTYTITYLNIENATNANPATYTIESNKITLADAQKTDYTFLGWYDSGDNLVTVIPKNSTGNKILAARWSDPQEYTISYNLNGGLLPSGETNPEKYNIETPVTKLVEPTKDNHEFVGWFSEENVKYEEIGGAVTGNLELIARWYAPSFSITYKIDGDEAILTPNKYSVDDNVTLPTPTKDGYTFDGWYVNDELNGDKVKSFVAGATEDKAFFGQWNKNEYSITYIIDGTEADLTPNKYTIEDAVKLATPIKAGYVFEGWIDSKTGYVITELPEGSFDDRSFIALWSDPIKYKITYNLNDGVLPEGVENPTEYTVEDAVTLPTPTYAGYDFVGWFDSGNNQVFEIKEKSTGDLELTAKWRYTVTYTAGVQLHAVNAYVHDSVATGLKGYDFILASAVKDFAIDGYKLDGWSTTDGGNVEYELGASYDGPDITLYPHWTLKTYTITYAAGANGSGKVESGEKTHGETYTLSSEKFIRNDGYEQNGWILTVGETSTEYDLGAAFDVDADVTLYPRWTATSYSITYELNEGELPEGVSNPAEYTVESAVTLPTPTKNGFEFVGWYDKEGDDGKLVEKIANGSTGNITLYAKWKIIEYKIVYHTNCPESECSIVNNKGISMDSLLEKPQYYNVLSEFELPTSKSEHYTFGGWFDKDSEDGQQVTEIAEGSTGDITLYARWTAVEYTITYKLNDGTLPDGVENPQTYTFESENFDLPIPTKTGYKFEGWFDQYKNPVGSISNHSSGDITLYAKWNAVEYTITYVTANGANSQPNVVSYTVEDVAGDKVIDLKPATRCGFEFAGWFKDKDLLGDAVAQIKNGDAENITLYPKWEKITDPEEDYGAVKIYVDKNGLRCAALDGESDETVEIQSDVEVSYVTFDREFTVNKTADDKKLATIVLPFTIAKNKVVGAEFFRMYEVDLEIGAVYITPVKDDSIYANTPYIVRATKANLTFNIGKDEMVKLNTSEMKNATSGEWELRGVYSYKKWMAGDTELGKAYGYTAKTTNKLAAGVFARNAPGAYINPFRAYLYNFDTKPQLAAPSPFLAKSTTSNASIGGLTQTSSLEVFIVDGSVSKTGENVEKGGTTSIITVKTAPARMKVRDGWYDMKGRKLKGKPTAKGIYYYNGKKIRIQ